MTQANGAIDPAALISGPLARRRFLAQQELREMARMMGRQVVEVSRCEMEGKVLDKKGINTMMLLINNYQRAFDQFERGDYIRCLETATTFYDGEALPSDGTKSQPEILNSAHTSLRGSNPNSYPSAHSA